MYIVDCMRKVLFLLFFISISLSAQEPKLVSSIKLDADTFVGFDSYLSLYSIKNMVLHKRGNDGAYIFNDYQLGDISSVDIINPLKIVVFYEDTNTVVFLDNKLNEIERIKFNELSEFVNIGSATNAGANKLWIFNVDSQQLELFDYRNHRKTTVSQPFPGKLISQASNFNYCYTLTENKIRAFNVYGSLLFEKKSDDYLKMIEYDKMMAVLQENQIILITENSVKPIKLPISENTIKDLQLTRDFLYIYDGNKLHTFSFKQPKQ